jgi:hypothetical protein
MKVSCKNLQKQEYSIECELSDSLSTILDKLEKAHGLKAETTTLIYAGQVLLDKNVTLEKLGYKDGDWFVAYPKKIKPSDAVKVQGQPLPSQKPKSVKSNITTTAPMARTPLTANNQANIQMSDRAVNMMLSILREDPRCNQLLAMRPDLEARLRNPQVLLGLAASMGLDLTRFTQSSEGSTNNTSNDEESPEISTATQEDTEESQEDSQEDGESNNSETQTDSETDNSQPSGDSETTADHSQREVVALPASEVATLTRIRQDLMAILGPLPSHITELQMNTIIYEAYVAAEKDPEITLNILIDQIMEHDS